MVGIEILTIEDRVVVIHQEARHTVGTYLYCIGRARSFGPGSPSFRSGGVGAPAVAVRTIAYADVAAVVSDAPITTYELTRDAPLAHERVVEEAMSRSDVLPVAIGTVARNDREVREQLLQPTYDELCRHLEYVRGRVELGLEISWNQDHLYFEIIAERDDIRTLRDHIARRPQAEVSVERFRLRQLVAAAIADKRQRDVDTILAALAPLAVEVRLKQLHTDMMILNAAFLVGYDQVAAFDAQVQHLDEIQDGRLVVRYAGPLPAYSFVNVRLGRVDDGGQVVSLGKRSGEVA
jgi:hypothetical protein